MGILLCCFRGPIADEEDEVTNRRNNHSGRGVTPKAIKDSTNHEQKEPELGLGPKDPKPRPKPDQPEPIINRLITPKSMLYGDGMFSRDNECPICFEGDEVPGDGLIVMFLLWLTI
ncbi:hypothetical protein E3N88_19600 [Mikania micrantha]|uniref:Uncharacterized protein n=1 Tax=Mikania micrantha TaxID=192012 RepID=A0A5N6NP56_9ASTR|nr:hypothetical protein E3N88_19600 [Mikania micrantha]